jgi:predicted transcriptional regulator
MTVRGASQTNGASGGLAPGASAESRLGPRRRRILETLRERPGLNLDEVALAIGTARTAAKYHLRSLELLGLVSRVRQGRHLLHFPSETPALERTMLCLVRVPSVRALAEALFVNPGHPRDRLAEDLDVNVRTVRRAVRQLTRSGLARVQAFPDGQHVVLHPRLRVLLARQAGPPAPAPAPGGEDIP